ncbi:MAG: hypothetical protein WKF83_07155 [Nocardioidaceae bacterium]
MEPTLSPPHFPGPAQQRQEHRIGAVDMRPELDVRPRHPPT